MSEQSNEEKAKGPHVKVQEKYNLFNESIPDFSWHGSSSSVGSQSRLPAGKTQVSLDKREGLKSEKSATDLYSRVEEIKEDPETSTPASLDRKFYKVFGEPVQKHEKHVATSKELDTHTEMKKIGERSTHITKRYYRTRHAVTEDGKNETKPIEPIFATRKEFEDKAREAVVTTKRVIQIENAKDLQRQPTVCKNLEIKYQETENHRKAKKDKKKKSCCFRCLSCCCSLCIQCTECI